MIISIGFDVIEIDRIARSVALFEHRFIARVFTQDEWQLARSRKKTAATLAKRFAAKEACAKALRTGTSQGITWQDIEVTKHTKGNVALTLRNKAYQTLLTMIPHGFIPQIHLSLSDDETRAYAWVIISARPL